jgi:tetratricopeptide (TPR) repeat protein
LQTDVQKAAEVIYILARIYKRKGRIDQAFAYYNDCLLIAREHGICSLEGACLRSLGELYILYNSEEEAGLKLYYQSLETLRGTSDLQSKKELIFTIQSLVNHNMSNKDYDLAETLASESLEVLSTIPDQNRSPSEGLANGARQLILIYKNRLRFSEAYKLIKDQRDALSELDLASSLGEVGNMMLQVEKFAEAEELFKDSFQLYQSIPNFGGCAWIKRCLGDLFTSKKEWEIAEKSYEESLEICRKHRLKAYQMYVALLNLSRFYVIKLRERKESAAWREKNELIWSNCTYDYKQFIANSDDMSKINVAEAVCGLGRELYKSGLYHDSLEVIKEAEIHYQSAKNLGGTAYATQIRGDCYLSLGMDGMAEDSYKIAVSLREKAKDESELAEALEGIGSVYMARAEKEVAVSYLKRSLNIYKDRNDLEGQRRVSRLLENYVT